MPALRFPKRAEPAAASVGPNEPTAELARALAAVAEAEDLRDEVQSHIDRTMRHLRIAQRDRSVSPADADSPVAALLAEKKEMVEFFHETKSDLRVAKEALDALHTDVGQAPNYEARREKKAEHKATETKATRAQRINQLLLKSLKEPVNDDDDGLKAKHVAWAKLSGLYQEFEQNRKAAFFASGKLRWLQMRLKSAESDPARQQELEGDIAAKQTELKDLRLQSDSLLEKFFETLKGPLFEEVRAEVERGEEKHMEGRAAQKKKKKATEKQHTVAPEQARLVTEAMRRLCLHLWLGTHKLSRTEFDAYVDAMLPSAATSPSRKGRGRRGRSQDKQSSAGPKP